MTGSASISVSLPSAFNNSATARLRFYEHSTTTGTTPTGSQPKISIDNVAVTSSAMTSAPTVTAAAASNTNTTSATLNGTVTANGGSALTDYGFYWSTAPTVTTGNTKIQLGTSDLGAYPGNISTSLGSLSVNTVYYYRAYANNAIGNTLGSADVSFYTLANAPAAPTVTGATAGSVDVAIGSGDGNPSGTTYAIQETGSGNYVQAGGTLSGAAVYQTAAAWGTKTVTGLSANTSYTFQAKARNGANVDTAFGSTASLYTLAATPAAPTVNGATTGSVDVAVNANGNPGGTTFAIQETGSGNYVQADGTLGGATVYQTASTWGTKTVTGLSVNVSYTFQVKARNANSVDTSFGSTASLYTLANTPAAPVVNNPTVSTLDVAIGSGDGNPAGTAYAIQETGGGLYVQLGGGLGGAAVWQTAGAWGTKTVSSLSSGTSYTFRAKARNGNNAETGFGSTASESTLAGSCTPPTIVTSPADTNVCAGGTVTLTVVATGTTLTYQWHRDGTNIVDGGHYSGCTTSNLTITGADAADATTTANGYACEVTENDNGPCSSWTAPLVALTINTAPAISAASGDQTTCENVAVHYTVTAGGSGLTYQWNLNGTPLSNGGLYSGVNTADLTVTPTSSGDTVSSGSGYDCTVSGTCASPQTSTRRALTVTATTTPSVSIAADTGTTICPNTPVTFTATPVNGGTTPSYQWKTNGVNVGTDSATYVNSGLVNGTFVTVVLTPSAEMCPATPTATASGLTMTVNSTVTPSVTVTANPGLTNCSGTEVVFTATPVNGGATPAYQWKTNNVNVGLNSANYTNAGLVNGTVVACIVTPSSEICVSPATASNGVVMAVNQFKLPGASTTIFSENVGTPGGTTTLASYTGWQNTSPITFTSTSALVPDIRITGASTTYSGASGSGNVFFTTTSGARNLVVSGINTLAYSSIQLQYGNLLASVGAGDAFVVEVSTDGTTYSPLTVSQPTASWSLITASGTIPATANLRLRFSKSVGASYRLDDIKLTGIPLVPTNAVLTASGPTTFNYGSSVTLTANAGGVAYQWFTNGVQDLTAVAGSYTATNSGTYAVTITDSQGCTSTASSNVTVVNPAITSQPVNVTNAPTTSVSFTVAAVGTPTLTYQWQHAGTNLPGAQSATLNLNNIGFADAGSYSVTVSNGLGAAVTSSTATLTLIDPAILTQPASRTNNYGTAATFSVTGASAGSLSYQWRKDGVDLAESAPNSGTTGSTLTVSPVAFADAGDYTVVVTSGSGAITSAVAVLTVNDPYIVTQPANQTNAAGTTASFTVVAAGTATVGYQWQRAGTNVPSATGATLSLPAVTQDDATNGNYTVIVSGAGLSVTSSAVSLTVVDAPVVLTAPASRTNSAGERVVLTSSSSGQLKSYQWRLNGVDIPGATGFNYTNTGVAAADAGDYVVVITNLAGSVTSTPPATLTVIGGNSVKVAQWNFNSTTPDAATGTGTSTPSTGSGTAALVGGTTATFAGGTASDPASTGTDNSRWSTASYPAQGTGEKTAGAEFAVSTVGYTNVIVSWEQLGSGTGSKYALLQYSTDGVTFLDTPKIITVNAAMSHYDYDFSGTAGVANNANFKFRVVTIYENTAVGGGNLNYAAVTSTYGTSGTEGFDMVTLFALPYPYVTTQPQSATNCDGSSVTFTAASATTPTPTAQWQVSTDSGASWSDLGGETANSYTFTAYHADNGRQYHVVYTNPYFSATSAVATLTVRAAPTANDVTYTVGTGSTLKLNIANLLTNDASAAVGPIGLASVANSTNSVTVSRDATLIYYSGVVTANDRFDYTITNACGESASGYVFITATTAAGQQGHITAVTGTGPFAAAMTFYGVLGTQYHVQRATDLSGGGNWTTLDAVTADSGTGVIGYTDTDAPSGGAYYRLIYP